MTAKKKYKSRKWMPLVLIIAVVVIVIVGVFLTRTKNNNEFSALEISPTQPAENIYKIDDLGLNFNYPKGWRVERTYTPSFHSVKFYSPEKSYIPNITLNVNATDVIGYINLANARPETIVGIKAMREIRPAGQNSSVLVNAVQFKKGKYYYNVAVTYESNPTSATPSDKAALQDFNNMLSSFHFSN